MAQRADEALPPSLPPLKLPQGHSPITISHYNDADTVIPKSPAASFMSRDSFSTAITSPSQTSIASPSSPPTGNTLGIPQSLRKSLSVDSFVQYGREPQPIVNTRPSRVNTGTALDPPRGLVFNVSESLKRERDRRPQVTRDRGASLSSVDNGYQSSRNGDSDIERSDSVTSVDGYRRVKGQEPSRPSIPGGELPLPSRTPTLSTASSMTSTTSTSTNSSNTQEGAPRTGIRATASLQSMARRTTPVDLSGRARSGSLGINPTSIGAPRRMLINTQVAADDPQRANLPISLLVVGVPGCGKTVTIRKGLKGFNLSDPIASLPAPNSSTRYTRRIGRLTESEKSTDCPLHIIELDILPSEKDITSVFKEMPAVDGVIICYDASSKGSFQPVEALLSGYREMKLPLVVLACKSDLTQEIDPQAALEVLRKYDVGLVEVSLVKDGGKEKMKRSFDWLLRAVLRDRRSSRNENDDYRNPASPELLRSPAPWESSRTATPTASSSSAAPLNLAHLHSRLPQSPLPTIPASRTSTTPNSPTRARSTGDLLSLSQQDVAHPRDWQANSQKPSGPALNIESNSTESLHEAGPTSIDAVNGTNGIQEEKKDGKEKESRPAQWATLDELLDKLMFLAVSGDDPTYITHFLLTYRRFASPRSVLLAMQKRMRQLDNPSGDPMFACFAQMRICHLLELWIRDYPYDFAVRGTAGALSALIKSIISKTYLLHYGSDFLPFLELLPTLVDKDSTWALKIQDSEDESDDGYSLLEDDDESMNRSIGSSGPGRSPSRSKPKPPPPATRERKASLPLTAKTFMPSSASTISNGSSEPMEYQYQPKQQLKDLLKIAQEVNMIDPEEIAQEITRLEVKLFLDIEPRHWLQYTLVSGKKDPETDTISRFNDVSNHLAAWVVSLILCHDKTKARVRQIEKFVEVAQKLRALNNYSALRAFVAGINSSTFPGDHTMEQFKAKSPEQAKNLQSWDVLLQHIRSHRAYRLALRNTKGACIPALEVHMSDLIRSHEGNPDSNSSDSAKIHWGKFNMMGRFISSTTQCQAQCRSTNDYHFVERPMIRDLILVPCLMNDEMQTSRIAPQDTEFDDHRPLPRTITRDTQPNSQPRDVALLRRLFFW